MSYPTRAEGLGKYDNMSNKLYSLCLILLEYETKGKWDKIKKFLYKSSSISLPGL